MRDGVQTGRDAQSGSGDLGEGLFDGLGGDGEDEVACLERLHCHLRSL